MKGHSFKRHVFDEKIRLLTIFILVIFGVLLVIVKSDLARDITLLVIGIIGGKYLRS